MLPQENLQLRPSQLVHFEDFSSTEGHDSGSEISDWQSLFHQTDALEKWILWVGLTAQQHQEVLIASLALQHWQQECTTPQLWNNYVRNFMCHQKPHPSNSFPFENTQSLLHVHIKILSTTQWQICMTTVVRLRLYHVWAALWVQWVATMYIQNITSWHLKLSIDELSTFQFQTCDLIPLPREGCNFYILVRRFIIVGASLSKHCIADLMSWHTSHGICHRLLFQHERGNNTSCSHFFGQWSY